MNHIKVKDNDHLYRDVNSGAIINTDRSSFEKYKRSKLKFQNMEHELDHLKGKVLLTCLDRKTKKQALKDISLNGFPGNDV